MAGSKKQIVYIHGGESFLNHEDYLERLRTIPLWHMDDESKEKPKKWTHNLESELGDEYQVITPPMPNRENAKYEEWKIWFERHFEYLNDEAILMGCSQGAMFLGRYLTENTLPFTAGAVFLMAGAVPLEGENHTDFGDFLIDLEKVSVITGRNKNVVIMHSKDDFVVPYHHGEALAAAMPNAEFIIYEDKNHFLIPEFPELVEKIKGLA